MTKDEALKLAANINPYGSVENARARDAAREALAQPEQEPVACPKCKGLGYYDEGHECDDGTMVGGNYVECEKCKQPEFIKHEVESAEDWSEWVCPNPQSYLMKCCDCGLVHEAQFNVVRYKSDTEREDCDIVEDPNLQAVFRMRRSEQWSPKDTAHRSGGLPMAQPEQKQQIETLKRCLFQMQEAAKDLVEQAKSLTPPQRTWVGLTDEDKAELDAKYGDDTLAHLDAIEAKLKEKNT